MKKNIVDRVSGAVEEALEVKSGANELSWKDTLDTVISGLLLILAAFIANIDLLKVQLATWGLNEFWIAIAVYIVFELGRKFLRDNR